MQFTDAAGLSVRDFTWQWQNPFEKNPTNAAKAGD